MIEHGAPGEELHDRQCATEGEERWYHCFECGRTFMLGQGRGAPNQCPDCRMMAGLWWSCTCDEIGG